MNSKTTAMQVLGAEQASETRKPFLLINDVMKAEGYISKVRGFGNEIEKFKTIFASIVTTNLNVTFDKSWLKTVLDGALTERVNKCLHKYLETQPTMLRSTLYKEFEMIAHNLEKPAAILKSSFDRSINQSAITYHPYPNGLDSFAAFPIDESGKLTITEGWEAHIKKQFETWLTTPQDFARYDALQACIDAQDKFAEVFGDFAPYVWQQFNVNGYTTSNTTTGEHLRSLIK